MALAAAMAGTGAALCGHEDTGQSFTLLGDAGKRYCGACFSRYRDIAEAFQAGTVDETATRTALADLLRSFARPLTQDVINAEVAFAIEDLIEDRDHAA